MAQIKATADWSMFRLVNTNRPINKRHVQRIKQSITKENLLELNPIIVNKDFHVIDGQHRLQAAKELKMPIYYIVSNKVAQEQIAILNTNKLTWHLNDYINYYAKNGNEAYKHLKKFLETHDYIPPSAAINIICDNVKTNDIREGKLQSVDLDKGAKLMQHILKFRNYTNEAFTRTFIVAVKHIIHVPGYSHERMIEKLAAQPKALVPCTAWKQYVKLLEEIYNYRAQNRLRFY